MSRHYAAKAQAAYDLDIEGDCLAGRLTKEVEVLRRELTTAEHRVAGSRGSVDHELASPQAFFHRPRP